MRLKEQLQNVAKENRKLDDFKEYLIKKMKDSAYNGKSKIKIRSFTLWFDGYGDKDLIDTACKWLETEGVKAFIKYEEKKFVINDEEKKFVINDEEKIIKNRFLCISWE